VVKLKRHSSSYEVDQGEQPQIVFIDRYQNGRPTCTPVEEQPQAPGSDDVPANPPRMHEVIAVREGILLGEEKTCPETNFFSLIRRGPETSCKSALHS